MKNEEYVPVIEAALFAAGFPVKFERLEEVLGLSHDDLLELLRSKAFEYKGRGIRLVMFSDSCQLCSNEDYEKQVKSILGMRSGGALSNSALEVLAIIAYKQPVTKGEIESIRGIRCDRVLEGLGKKKLVAEVGRSDAVGRPILYGTTDEFLKQFGFSTLKELPDIVDIEGALDEENGENDMLYSQQISIDLSQAEPDRTDK